MSLAKKTTSAATQVAKNTEKHADSSGISGSHLIGFMLGHEQFPVPELVELGVAAEAAGFDLLAVSDHFQPWQDNEGHSGSAWATLAALTQRTTKCWMGPAVTCPILRYNPAVVAEVFASLDQLAPGRIFLGVGSGEALNEEAATGEWPSWRQRSERLIEAVDLIKKLWSGDFIVHEGKYYDVAAKFYDTPTHPIPILMAANGPQAMHRAGKYADGLITDTKTWQQHKGKYDEGLREAGKQLGDIPVLIEHYVVVGDENDAKQAAEKWRFSPKAFAGYQNISDPRQIRALADAEIPLQDVYKDWPIGINSKVHINAIEELFDSGATIINVHSGQNDQRRVIDFYGKEVLPQIKKTKMLEKS